jgi:hypothetical protein
MRSQEEGELRMGVASMVLGIVSAIVGFIPICGTVAILPAIIGLLTSHLQHPSLRIDALHRRVLFVLYP